MRVGRVVTGAALAVVTLATATVPSVAQSGGGIQDTIDRLSLREKVGQLVMFAVDGLYLTDRERAGIRRAHIGGVILFAQNYDNRAQLDTLTTQIQRWARRGNRAEIGALISVDQEGGVVKRFPDMPPRYSAPQLGDMNDRSLTYDQGRATGRALRANGVNVNLAPVADLDLPPNHIMRSRSFGAGRRLVARMVNAFARGLQSKRVAATAKHFPGLGGATINTDNGPAYVYRSKRQLHTVDAVPFRRAIEGGLRMVMVGHAMYMNDGGRRPASLSRYIATKRLRREFAFNGIAISDALEAVAWRFDGDTTKACKGTIRAGVDVALITGGIDLARRCADRIYNGVLRGEISRERVDQAVTRVLRLKEWLGI